MRCVGYRQAWRFLDGEIDREALRATGIAATRQLAKRQITWLRAMETQRVDPYEHPPWPAIERAVERALEGR